MCKLLDIELVCSLYRSVYIISLSQFSLLAIFRTNILNTKKKQEMRVQGVGATVTLQNDYFDSLRGKALLVALVFILFV